MRQMSVALTEDQVRAGTKDVTRRLGWRTARVGDEIQLVRKAMGLRKGEHPVKVRVVELVAVTFEPLNVITPIECRREGFPDMTPDEFIEFFCQTHTGCTPLTTVVTRLEWIYIDGPRQGAML